MGSVIGIGNTAVNLIVNDYDFDGIWFLFREIKQVNIYFFNFFLYI